MKQFLSLAFGILILTTCGSPKSIQDSKNTGECAEEATVRDYTGLDACRFLLELKDGTRLIPVELSDKEFLFSEGQLVKISYKKMKDVVTACLTRVNGFRLIWTLLAFGPESIIMSIL